MQTDENGFFGFTTIFWMQSPVYDVKVFRGACIAGGMLSLVILLLDVSRIYIVHDESAQFRLLIVSVVINAYSVLDIFARIVIGFSPMTWLSRSASCLASESHFLPSIIIKIQAAVTFVINVLAIAFRAAGFESAAVGCMATSCVTGWIYGFTGVCMVQITYGILLSRGEIRLPNRVLDFLFSQKQAVCIFSPVGPCHKVGSCAAQIASDDGASANVAVMDAVIADVTAVNNIGVQAANLAGPQEPVHCV
jgi:hypothetical protein